MAGDADPAVGPGEVLIAVHAAGVNRADLLQAAGKYPPPPGVSDVLGSEVSGTVVDVAADVRGMVVGQQVCKCCRPAAGMPSWWPSRPAR